MYYLERNEDVAIIFLKFYQNYAFYKRLAILKLILSEYIRVPRTELFIGLCILVVLVIMTGHPKISIHILHTVLHTFLKVLTRRISLTITSFFGI